MTQQNIRFGVIGLGHIAQVAVLPALAHAKGCELAAIISNDEEKLTSLGDKYSVKARVRSREYDTLLSSGEIDAVYVALPNHLHCEYSTRALDAGLHVLCEKPMAVTAAECTQMIKAANDNERLLMIAYRLHFERLNLAAADTIQRGMIGQPRYFTSSFSQNIRGENVRLAPLAKGGGSVYDMGIYCINAARYLFRSEPEQVVATSYFAPPRFAECDQTTSATLRFSDGRLAQFTTSFDALRLATYRVVGTEGEVEVYNAYDYAKDMRMVLRRAGGDVTHRRIEQRDQFTPELVYFAECIRKGTTPEPDGREGRRDIRIIEAIHEAARTRSAVALELDEAPRRPSLAQSITRPRLPKPREIRASAPGD